MPVARPHADAEPPPPAGPGSYAGLLEAAGRRSAMLDRVERLSRLGTFEFERETGLMRVSNGLLALFGITAEAFADDPRRLYEALHPEDVPPLGQAERLNLDGLIGPPKTFRIRRADGRVRRLVATAERRRDGSGDWILGTLQDVSEREAARRLVERQRTDLEDAYARLRALDDLKQDFVQAISHDLRTPLTSLLGFAEFLADELDGPLSARQHERLAQIQRSGARLRRMIDDLLDHARLESAELQLDCRLLPLGPLVSGVLESLAPQALEAGVALKLADLAPDAVLPLDPDRLERVVTNLVANAIKFSPAGAEVSVSLSREPGGLRCAVSDRGPGLSPAEVDRVFDRFVQFEAGRRLGGTGLGLAIAKAIIEAHRGTIGVESAVGTGSTFWFELPLPRGDA